MADVCELRVLDVRVPMREGVELATDVTLVDKSQPHPALLVRTSDGVIHACDEHPDGPSLNVVDSIQRTTWHPRRPHDVDLRVGSTAMWFRRGPRVRVLVASSDFPQYDLLRPGEQTFFLGSSRVVLPVVDPGVPEHG